MSFDPAGMDISLKTGKRQAIERMRECDKLLKELEGLEIDRKDTISRLEKIKDEISYVKDIGEARAKLWLVDRLLEYDKRKQSEISQLKDKIKKTKCVIFIEEQEG
jgi:hypothetical protein